MLTYFLQVNLCWLLFYGLYYALLSRETFFTLNRIYLIVSLLAGLVIPLSIFNNTITPSENTVQLLQPFVVTATAIGAKLEQSRAWNLELIAYIVYATGSLVVAVRFLFGLSKIFKIYMLAEKCENPVFTLAYTEEIQTPFSFFKCIFIPKNLLHSADFQNIIAHEKAHIEQRHSLDVVFVELLNIVFWCSPFLYFYKKSLKIVHEYLADAAVLASVPPPQYGRLLLRQTQPAMSLAFVNPFYSQLKKRFIMMTKSRSSKKAILKYTFFIPLALIVALIIQSCKQDATNTSDELTSQVDQLPEFPGGQLAMFKFLSDNIKYPEQAKDDFSEGTTYLAFVVEKDGSISDISIKKTSKEQAIDTITMIDPTTYASTTRIVTNTTGKILDAEALRVVKTMPKWIAGKKNGEAVRANFVLPIKFKLEAETNDKVWENAAKGMKADTVTVIDNTGVPRKIVVKTDGKDKSNK
jgi:beta-lactamase regulating signal transducer with metallopeptidase domain